MIAKQKLGPFLSGNPFARPLTDGLFYREKMRAIHRVAPKWLRDGAQVLEVGGGRGGLASMLYPQASVVNVDIDPEMASHQPRADIRFVCGDACDLPFEDETFDLVTMFDVLEHINDDHEAAREAMRVLRPGGAVLVSTPRADWRYPYFRFMRPFCPPEEELMSRWGHVRRGYEDGTLETLFGGAPHAASSFTNPLTAFWHDVSFSRLGGKSRHALYALTAIPTVLGYLGHSSRTRGTEIVAAWQR